MCFGRKNNVMAILKPDPESTLQCASFEVRLVKRPISVQTMKFLRTVKLTKRFPTRHLILKQIQSKKKNRPELNGHSSIYNLERIIYFPVAVN